MNAFHDLSNCIIERKKIEKISNFICTRKCEVKKNFEMQFKELLFVFFFGHTKNIPLHFSFHKQIPDWNLKVSLYCFSIWRAMAMLLTYSNISEPISKIVGISWCASKRIHCVQKVVQHLDRHKTQEFQKKPSEVCIASHVRFKNVDLHVNRGRSIYLDLRAT